MPIIVSCLCGKRFHTRDEHAGKQAKCPGCGSLLTIPHLRSVKFKCSRCSSIQEISEDMVGYPEVCLNCKNATLVTDEKLQLELTRQTKRYETRKKLQKLFYGFGIGSLIAGSLCEERSGGIAYFGNTLVILGVLSIVANTFLVPSWRMAHKWVLKLDPKWEATRREVCLTVIEQREKGENARLCHVCTGTKKGNFGKCKECGGLGYLTRQVEQMDNPFA